MMNLKDILVSEIDKIPDSDVALLLSDGIDSKSIFYSALEAGKNITAYTFYMNESKDINGSRIFCKNHDIKLVEIPLPNETDILKKDLFRLSDLGCIKKTEYECFWPMLYVYQAINEKYIVSGLGADGYFCLSKSCAINYKQDLAAYRRKLFTDTYCQMHLHDKMTKHIMIAPYLTDGVKQYFDSRTDYYELNKPKQKNEIRKHFPELNNNSTHTSYQKLGISELFDSLVNTNMNLHDYKSVTGILNSINRHELTLEIYNDGDRTQ